MGTPTRLPGIGVTLPVVSPEAIVTAAAWAEELGFDSVWTGDHVIMPHDVRSPYPYGPDTRWTLPPETHWFDPIVVLAHAGSATRRVQLGTGVLVLPLRQPMLLAKQLASLDVVTGGRVVLGIGVGWMREESEALGINFDERWPRTREMVELMRLLWTGEPTTYAGRHYHADGLVAHPRPVRIPPILWGGRSLAALRHVARLGDGWYPLGLEQADFASRLDELRDLCSEYGRDPATLSVTPAIGRSARLTSEVALWYGAHGADRVLCTPPRDDLSAYRAELERIAVACGLV